MQPFKCTSEKPCQHPQDQRAAGPLQAHQEAAGTSPTYHALHLLGDVIVSIAVGSLHVHL